MTSSQESIRLLEWIHTLPDDMEDQWARLESDRVQIEAWMAGPNPGLGGLHMAFRRAEVAYMLQATEAGAFLDEAVAMYHRYSGNGDFDAAVQAYLWHKLLKSMLNKGDVAAAAELMDLLRPQAAHGLTGGLTDSQFHAAIGDFESAENSLRSIQSRTEQFAASMPENTDVASVNASMRMRIASYQAAQGKSELARESLLAAVKSFKPASYQANLHIDFLVTGGETCLALGDAKQALKLVDQAAAVPPVKASKGYDPTDTNRDLQLKICRMRAKALLAVGGFEEAESEWYKALELLKPPPSGATSPRPPHHPEVIEAREGLAWALLLAGKREGAVREALAVHEAQMELASRLFSYSSERQRLSFLQATDPYSLLAATGQIKQLADTVVKLKGSVLDSVLEDRRSAALATAPEARQVFNELQKARRLAIDSAMQQDRRGTDWDARVDSLQARLGAITQSVGKGRENLLISADQVRGRLAVRDALCEFIRYNHALPEGGWQAHYGALVIRRDADTEWIPLGEAASVEQAIARLNGGVSGAVELSEDELGEGLKDLNERLLAPLASALGSATRLILCPDGDLSCLSFAVLLDASGKFAAERWDMGYVSTSRDLLEDSGPMAEAVELVIFADPDFASNLRGGGEVASFRSIAVPYSLEFPLIAPLPGTRKELEVLQGIGKVQGWKVEAFAGAEATETRAAGLSKSPTILHFATHGLFLERQGAVKAASSDINGVRVDDPLQRSLLTMAGAQKTFEQWSRREAPEAATDGILNAAEISLLDLEETWLATLSACDTATGESLEGEGVMGLRRGFFLAGVDHLLMTFWPIADEETVALMESFYKELPTSSHPTLALSKVQREALGRFREERGLFGAVALAGPFAISFSGVLPAK